MDKEYSNVKLIGPANVYFDGRVSSRTFYEPDGTKKTLGFVTKGEYTFSTSTVEYMDMHAGVFGLKLPGEKEYTMYSEGESFVIPKGIEFDVKTDTFADYCCTYKDE